ncbi:MAG: metal ABC transporter substrate-binding protein [Thermoleophilia bacterium]
MANRLPSMRAGRALGAALILALVLLLLALIAAGCGSGAGGVAGDSRPLVVASVPIIYSLTANVAGDAVRLENLLPPGSSPHQVSFTPGQARLLHDADILIVNGAGLEPWVDDLVAASGNKTLRVVVASKGLEFLQPGEPVPIPGSKSDQAEEPTNVDPHVWLDPANARRMVDTIANGLAQGDPADADAFRQRAATYNARLETLDTEIRAALQAVPNRRFISFHSAFQYYARAYGLEQAAVIEEFPGKEPSPQYLAGLVRLVKESGVTAVFSEPQFSPRPADALAREAGVTVYEVDPEGAILAAALYEDLMRANTATFVKALGGGS